MIHEMGPRNHKKFIKVNCSAIPSDLIESSLFGHLKGSFTGAIGNRQGYFEQANGGTIFLDEVADLSISAQAKILRAIQDREIQKVGSEVEIKVDVRIVAATNKDFKQLIAKGEFREDLYYRLNVIPLQTIPLRQNMEDFPLLVEYFLNHFASESGKSIPRFNEQSMHLMSSYSWPGNVRELRNILERLIIMSSDVITPQDLPYEIRMNQVPLPHTSNQLTLREYRDLMERQYIIKVLKENNGNVSMGAKALDIERTHLYRKMKDFGILREDISF